MVQQPLVSVVVPFLNPGRFLDEAIQSVFAQCYTRWELLLVDDGSNDGSSEMARRYAEQHPDKIRTLEHPGHHNLGQSASRNLGIRNARGELLAFLDADDVWLPHKLEHQVPALLEARDVGMICSASEYWYSWTGLAEDRDRDHTLQVGGPQDTIVRPPALFRQLYPLGTGTAPCLNSILLWRSIVQAVGGFEEGFCGRFGMYEDQAFLVKVYLEASVLISSRCYDRYRNHPISFSHIRMTEGNYSLGRFYFLEWLERYLDQKQYHDRDLQQVAQRALCEYRHPVAWFLSELGSDPRRALRRIGGKLMRKSLPEPAYNWVRRRVFNGHAKPVPQ